MTYFEPSPNREAPRKGAVATPVTILFGILLGGLLFVGALIVITGSALQNDPPSAAALAQMTVIPAPTITPTVPVVDEGETIDVRYVSPEGFSIGAYVKIQNTQGAGLKIRPNPGTDGNVKFIADEGELFIITEGPDDRNGYTWWKLEGFENPERAGWGASAFFELVAPPSGSPTDR